MGLGIVGATLLGSGISAGGSFLSNLFNKRSADKQMDFQRDMSNTAYQRSMQDMRAAGLNPMLAYGQGGASTPGGASIAAQNPFQDAAATALGAVRLKQDISESGSRIQANLADVDLKRASAEAARASARNMNEQAEYTNILKFPASLQNDFLRQYPGYIPAMRILEGIGSLSGTARDLGIFGRTLKGFGGESKSNPFGGASHAPSNYKK